MTSVPEIRIAEGVRIPQLGFGVYQVPPQSTEEAVATALEVGYRHIDTAQMYGNEQGVGDALKASGLSRDEVFVTSKLNNGFHRRDDALRAFDQTLADLGLETLDLFLVHWPLPTIDVDYVETWKAMELLQKLGRVKSIGFSNCTTTQFESCTCSPHRNCPPCHINTFVCALSPLADNSTHIAETLAVATVPIALHQVHALDRPSDHGPKWHEVTPI
jgi:diketogulonate reductase-like aldo/keto reductase